jgi:hypothetical protein
MGLIGKYHRSLPAFPSEFWLENTIEATFDFSFSPDLCPIVQEGLPLALGFPNWRSSSP